MLSTGWHAPSLPAIPNARTGHAWGNPRRRRRGRGGVIVFSRKPGQSVFETGCRGATGERMITTGSNAPAVTASAEERTTHAWGQPRRLLPGPPRARTGVAWGTPRRGPRWKGG